MLKTPLWAIFSIGLLVVACIGACNAQTNLADGLAPCSADVDCPQAYHCATDRTCWGDGRNPSGFFAGDASAACPGALVDCGGTCLDPLSSGAHCGATVGCGIDGVGTAGEACGRGLVCNAGSCSVSCPANQVNCEGVCVDPATDPVHCGATQGCGAGDAGSAGTACVNGTVCNGGSCASSCSASTTNCGGGCFDTMTDPAHCGGCGTRCALANVTQNACVGGACALTACASGFGDCDGLAANGCETATNATDVNNCGGCAVRCTYANAAAQCTGGTCSRGACAAGFADCDGTSANGCEINTQSSFANCGGCGTPCASGQVCSLGVCGASCGAGLINCSGSCVNQTVDAQHCGSCTNACALPHVAVNACASSACVVGACAPGFSDCDGSAANGCETPTSSNDVNNCGGCGIRCRYANAGATCTAGVCSQGTCNAGFADCDGNPANGCEVNTNVDGGNCGACANACASGQVCSAGMCGTTCGAGLANCSGSCANLATDVQHCGSCPSACALSNVSVNACASSSCVVGACATGWGDCDGSAANGCETATRASDVNNCGGCGIHCSFANAAAACAAGVCTMGACNAGYADCDGNPGNGCEVNTRADNGNCGACLNACGGGQVCSLGMCGTSCGGGLTNCSGGCYDLTSSPAHCSSCANTCPVRTNAIAVCAASTCASVCQAGFGDCNMLPGDGCEATFASDANNCGRCGKVCPGGSVCLAGQCDPPSPVVFYKMNENAGTAVSDGSGSGRNATLASASWTQGIMGSGALSSGFTNSALPPLGNVFTISFWVRRDGNDGGPGGFPRVLSMPGDAFEVSDYARTGVLGLYIPGSTPGWVSLGQAFGSGYNHLAFVANGTSLVVYWNGAVITTLPAPAGLPATQLFFGQRYLMNGDEAFLGGIDQLRVYDTALNAARIAQLAAIPTTGQFFDDFSLLTGGSTGVQCTTGNPVRAFADLPGWNKAGLNVVHGEQATPGNTSLLFFDTNVLTMASGVAANAAGTEYLVKFRGGPGVWNSCPQATAGGDAVVIDVLRPNDTVVATYTYSPPSWAGAASLAPASFSYTGDGSGNVRLRLSDNLSNGRCGGAIDDLGIYSP